MPVPVKVKTNASNDANGQFPQQRRKPMQSYLLQNFNYEIISTNYSLYILYRTLSVHSKVLDFDQQND
jgi:hypothetical protein